MEKEVQKNENENARKMTMSAGPMLNAYPDSIGIKLSELVEFLKYPELDAVFQSLYILPTIFNTDLDRGFSVIDYNLNEILVSASDLEGIKMLGMDFKFDFILNHASVLSEEFQDVLKNGEKSKYIDFFINWNKFWEGHGQMTKEGYIQPDEELLKDMFFRKPGLPILNVTLPNGKVLPYWNTFYQEVKYDAIDAQDLMRAMTIQYATAKAVANLVNSQLAEGKKPSELFLAQFSQYDVAVCNLLEKRRKYLGQMDLNIQSPLVWDFYEDTLRKLSNYGAKIVRLDAFAYAPKAPGEKNFLNEYGTWELLGRVKSLADQFGLQLLPEIHSKYEEKTHEKISEKGFMTYDFFLPGLIIDAFERQTAYVLKRWILEIQEKNIKTVNMLGCHDGIPLLDLKGLLTDAQIEQLIDTVVARGGYVKDLHGQKNIYYQVNATYFSALGEDEKKLLLARAIQMFMPGKPQIWYLDLFAGTNDYEAVKKAGEGGHKEINRTNLTIDQIKKKLTSKIVLEQLELIKLRNTCPAFGFDAQLEVFETNNSSIMKLEWRNKGYKAILEANFEDYTYQIKVDNICLNSTTKCVM